MSNAAFSICSWNVRGLGDQDKCTDILSELISINPHIALLQESKLETLPDQKLRSFMPRHLDQVFSLPDVGSAGGTISAVNPSFFQVISFSHLSFSSTLILRSSMSDQNIAITNIYAPSSRALKQEFLNELLLIAQPDNSPWLLVGDFNLLRFPSDKNNAAFRQAEANAFNQTIDDLALIELPLLDRQFTWSNNRNTPTLERIDSAFFNLAWANAFPNSSLTSLTRFMSDHVPLIITVTTTIPRSNFFKFEPHWAQLQPCRDTVSSIWATIQPTSLLNAGASLASWLKQTRATLKKWASSRVPAPLRESRCKIAISALDLVEESRPLSRPEQLTRQIIVSLLKSTILEKVSYWKWRAKVSRAIHGGENSRFFHMSASHRMRRNKIFSLTQDGSTFTSHP